MEMLQIQTTNATFPLFIIKSKLSCKPDGEHVQTHSNKPIPVLIWIAVAAELLLVPAQQQQLFQFISKHLLH